MLLALADRVELHADELGRLLTQEQGRPLQHTIGEVRGMARRFRYWSEQTLDVEVLEDSDEMRVEARRKPLGAVAAIVPWNFPLGMMSWKISPSLLVGNTVVVKPAPTTPLTTLRFGELVHDLLPPGVLNIITDDNDLGALLAEHRDVAKVSFTGSITTCRKVMAGAPQAPEGYRELVRKRLAKGRWIDAGVEPAPRSLKVGCQFSGAAEPTSVAGMGRILAQQSFLGWPG